MILACEQESAFEDIWKGKVRYAFPKSGRAKKCVKIKNAFHLVRTIVYVSQPLSSCDKGEIPDTLSDPVQASHFHINRPLHPHSIAFLCTLFPGGIEQLLWEQLGNKNVSSWEKVARHVRDRWYNVKWGVPLHVTGWKFLNCVIPLYPHYEETEECTPLYLNLYNNKKMYVKEGHQGAECSFQCIRDEVYVLSRKQQNIMNEVKKTKQACAMDHKLILKSKLDEMKTKNDQKLNEMKARNDLMERERDLIQREKDVLKKEMDVVKKEMDVVKNEMDVVKKEKDEVKEENGVLKKEKDELNAKVQGMSGEIKILKDLLQRKRVNRISSNTWRWNKRVKRLNQPPSAISQL